jgi:heme exporter protein D
LSLQRALTLVPLLALAAARLLHPVSRSYEADVARQRARSATQEAAWDAVATVFPHNSLTANQIP